MNTLTSADRSFYTHLFSSIAEDMGATLCRTAHSPNIKERRDYSCAVFDARGLLIAQAAHIPVHLGALPATMEAVLSAYPRLREGDVIIVNDPYAGGTHLPDITLVSPVFAAGRKVAYLVSRAHHADVGGISPGSLPLSTHIDEEGVRIPPTRLVSRGQLDRSWLEEFLGQVRTPEEREGDIHAQLAAHHVGEHRFQALVEDYGAPELRRVMRALQQYGEDVMRHLIGLIPDGVYEFVDYLDDDGHGTTDLRIQVSLCIQGQEARLDFAGTAAACRGSLNAVPGITQSAVYYCFLCLLFTPGLMGARGMHCPPVNAGSFRPIAVVVPGGSIVHADEPHAVAGGNVETSQRIVDVVLGALAQALPGLVPAASQGTMNNLTMGGVDPRTGKTYAYYETTGGGAGASAGHPGLDAVQVHMTNTLNTPIEALEFSYPFRVRQYGIRTKSGGAGVMKGGEGICREIEVLGDAEATLLTERRSHAPYGLNGGEAGRVGINTLIRGSRSKAMPGKARLDLKAGDRLRMETPGGGGWGNPCRAEK